MPNLHHKASLTFEAIIQPKILPNTTMMKTSDMAYPAPPNFPQLRSNKKKSSWKSQHTRKPSPTGTCHTTSRNPPTCILVDPHHRQVIRTIGNKSWVESWRIETATILYDPRLLRHLTYPQWHHKKQWQWSQHPKCFNQRSSEPTSRDGQQNSKLI